MANAIITIIISFNVILLVLYFAVRIHKGMMDRASDAYKKVAELEKLDTLEDDDMEKIRAFLYSLYVPVKYKNAEMTRLIHGTITLDYIIKGKIDRLTNDTGIIIGSSATGSTLNLIPITFLDRTKKDVFWVRNDQLKLVGFYTPFNIFLINTETMKCTKSTEDDKTENSIEIPLTGYTKENIAVSHFTCRFHEPFHDAHEFIANYYLAEYKGIMKNE